ncbi:MAG: restriction endonuclease subunit S [Ignavibacteriales bacterium]|nr:MAG: restriction endonuclease subunit S [Ignavibacteriales bacterium]
MNNTWRDFVLLQNLKYFEFANGLWTGKKPPFQVVTVVRNTNFTNSGKIDYSNVAILAVEEKQFSQRQLIFGDIIIERSGGGPKQPVGRVVYFDKKDGNFSFSNFTSRIRVVNDSFDTKFVFYFLMHFYEGGNTTEMQSQTTGIRNLDFAKYKSSVHVPLLPLQEQRKIAYLLSTVQKAIEQQEKLIRHTTDLKKALMQKLFTEGTLGEKQKKTEIGMVPESWEVVEIKSLFEILQGKQVSKTNRIGKNQKPFLRTANVFWGNIDFSELDKMNFTKEEEKKFRLIKDDLLVCEGGDIGRTAIWEYDHEEIYYQNHLHRMRRKTESIIPKYFMYWMSLIVQETSYVKDAGNRTTIPNLSKSRLGGLYFPLPGLSYQEKVVTTLEGLDKKINFHEKKRNSLTSVFKVLLHELMTGKRRVDKIKFN